MASVLDIIKHYQHAIEKYSNDEGKVLRCIDKLFQLKVTVQHLQETGVGRTVNALRKEPGEVGQAARALVLKWKTMVAAEESDQEGDHKNDTSIQNGHGSGRDSDDHSHKSRTSSDQHNSISTPKLNSDYQKEMNGHHSGSKRKYHSSEDEDHDDVKKKTRHTSSSEDDPKKHVVIKKEKVSESESSDEDSESSDSDSDSYSSESSQEEVKVKQEIKKEKESPDTSKSSSSKHSHSNHDKKHSSSSKSHESDSNSRHKSSSKDETRHSSEKYSKSSSDKYKKSHEKENSSEKHHKSSDVSEKKHVTSDDRKHKSSISDEKKDSKSSSRHSSDKQKSSSHKHESSSERHKSSSDKQSSKEDKSSSHTDKATEKHKSLSDKESSKHKSKESSSSSKEIHRSSSKEKSKDRSSSSKDRSSSSKDRSTHSSHSEKKQSSGDSKSHSSDKSKHKSDDSSDKSKHKGDESSEKKSKDKKSSSSHKSKSSSSSSNLKDVPKKKSKLSNSEDSGEDGIDCGSGASFAEALGMISPTKSKKKIKDVNSPSNPFTNNLTPAALLAPTAKLAPLPALEISALPDISPNYKPRPPPKVMPHFNDEDAISAGISSKNQRTKVYSGNKAIGKIPSLYEMCVHVLQEHIDALEYTGGVPYDILKPVVDRASPQQLFLLEHYNPYLMEETDHLWKKFCDKSFRNKKRQELESWREMFMRCQEEQEHKLKSLTANIKLTQEAKKAPIKQTKMAYVDTIVKPPRNIARKQAQHGTAHAATASPASRVASLSTTPGVLKGGSPRPPPAPSVSASAFNKPKKAPLMQKALQFMRGRKR